MSTIGRTYVEQVWAIFGRGTKTSYSMNERTYSKRLSAFCGEHGLRVIDAYATKQETKKN